MSDSLDPEVLRIAKQAAERAGVSIWTWLNRCIGEAAAAELNSDPNLPNPPIANLPALPMDMVLRAIEGQSVQALLASQHTTKDAVRPLLQQVEELTGKLRVVEEMLNRAERVDNVLDGAAAGIRPLEHALSEALGAKPVRHLGLSNNTKPGLLRRLFRG